MPSSTEPLPTIENNVRISLANSGQWIGPADNGAIAALLRLARLIDQLFDIGETKDLPQLLARLTVLMEQLRLTPKARQDQDLTPKEELKDGSDFQAAYLRLVGAESPDNTSKGKKPRASSGRTSASDRGSTPTVAKKRP
jgi:hypothetical protein